MPEQEQQSRGFRLVALTVVFSLTGGLLLVAVPLITTSVGSRKQGMPRMLVLAALIGVVGWWLVLPGDLPEQALKAATVIAGVSFALLSAGTCWSVTHRALLASLLGLAGAGVAMAVLGQSWNELMWAVEMEVGMAWRAQLGRMWETAADAQMVRILEDAHTGVTSWLAGLSPAFTFVRLWAGMALAAAWVYRMGSKLGRGVGQFRNFRFSEHLGWLAVVGLLLLLFAPPMSLRILAVNLLVVTAALYGVRGLAVASFSGGIMGCSVAGIGLAAVIGMFLLPGLAGPVLLMIATGMILLGVLDSGLNLRERWEAPSPRG